MPITPVHNLIGERDGSVKEWLWTLLSANTDGVGVEVPEYGDITWTADGTFGGATVAIEGSGDNVNFYPIKNVAGAAAITFTAGGMAAGIENPRYVRARLSVAGAGATILVRACCRRPNPMRN